MLALLALAGLLRPEAWAFSGLYWLYLLLGPHGTRRELAGLALLAPSAPLLWLLSDLAITGDPLWSLTNTRHTAETLDRVTGIANVPEYIPRRIGEILRPPVLVGAALGGVLSLLWLRARALVGRGRRGRSPCAVFAAFATIGLPINTRYAFLAAAILLHVLRRRRVRLDPPERGGPAPALVDGGRRARAGGAASPTRRPSTARRTANWTNWHASSSIENDLLALVDDDSITLRCGPVGVPNHAPHPAARAVSEDEPREHRERPGQADLLRAVRRPGEPGRSKQTTSSTHTTRTVRSPCPPGFTEAHANRSWLVFPALRPIAGAGPCTPRRDSARRTPIAARDSGPGAPAAPAGDRLRLLPSGPDLVRKPTPRGTRTIDAPNDGATGAENPSKGSSAPLERIADTGHRYLPA